MAGKPGIVDEIKNAFEEYKRFLGMLGRDVSGHEIARGPRSIVLAEYGPNNSIIRAFSTRAEALSFYTRYVEIGREVTEALGHIIPVAEGVTTDVEMPTTESTEQTERAEESAATPTPKRRRVAVA